MHNCSNFCFLIWSCQYQLKEILLANFLRDWLYDSRLFGKKVKRSSQCAFHCRIIERHMIMTKPEARKINMKWIFVCFSQSKLQFILWKAYQRHLKIQGSSNNINSQKPETISEITDSFLFLLGKFKFFCFLRTIFETQLLKLKLN